MQRAELERKIFKEEFVKPSLKFGALGGAFGLILGTITGTLRSKTPFLFATASGIQCFALGATYWGSRATFLKSEIFHPSSSDQPTSSTFLKASSAAGCFTGSSMGLMFRGPRNIIPGAIMFTIFGYTGQRVFNFLDERHTRQVIFEQENPSTGFRDDRLGFWRRFVDWLSAPENTWSPLKKISDPEYEDILQEKLLEVEADLAMIDDEIERIRQEAQAKEGQQEHQDADNFR